MTSENKSAKISSGEPGIALKDALEKARILFYKVKFCKLNRDIKKKNKYFLQGKQAAIFVNPNGGYDVRVLDENDENINHDGNLLRSIVLTEVKLRPKTRTTPLFNAPPPPTSLPPLKVHDENEITDDFRRSIDAALKGLEAVYQTTTTTTAGESIQEVHVEKTTTKRPISPPPILQCGVTNPPLPKSISKEQTNLPNEQPPPAPIDNTVHLAEIIRQMAEQQKIASEQLSKPVDDTSELTMDAVDATITTTTTTVEGNLISSNQTETTEQIVTAVSQDESQGQIERIVREIREHGEKYESKESLPLTTPPAKQVSSYSLGLTSPLQNEPITTTEISSSSSPPPPSTVQKKGKLRSENRPKSFISTEESGKKDTFQLIKQMSLDEIAHLTQTGLSNPNLTTSVTKLGISTSSGKIEEEHLPTTTSDQALTKMATSISQIIEEHQPILEEPTISTTTTGAAPVVSPVGSPLSKVIKSPSHNVTYTEIIHSESRDGEQSRHFITESYDEHPSNEDEQTTTLKVITKSEFSNDPTSGEKIMEQSVQVITVKVRNETIKTTIQQATLPTTTTETDIAYERRPVSELVKNFEVASGNTNT